MKTPNSTLSLPVRELMIFRTIVTTIAMITIVFGPLIGFGGLGAFARFLHLPIPANIDPGLHNNLRAVAMIFPTAGAMLVWSVMRLQTGKVVFRIAVCGIVLAGLARLTGWYIDGYPGTMPVFLLVVEIVVFPILLIWHTRLCKVTG